MKSTTKKTAQRLQRSTRPAPSVGAQALNKKTAETETVTAVEGGADMSAVAASAMTVIEERAEKFVSKLSDQTLGDLAAGWQAEEKLRKNPLEIMFDLRGDYENDLDGLRAFPKPFTEAPKGMTPLKWKQTKQNEPWPFDKWSDRVAQSQGGKRNENYSFYLIAFEKTRDGKIIADKIAQLKELIADQRSKSPKALPGEYQGWDHDQLETELNKYEGRRTRGGASLRKAIGLDRQFNAFEEYAENLTKTGKGPWKYPTFSVATVIVDGNEEPAPAKKSIRFGITELSRDGNKEREATTWKRPISVDTFLDYDIDLFKAAVNVPGADVYNAVTESAGTGSDNEEPKAIKLPFSADSWIASAGLFAGFIEQDENRAAVIKKLTKKDAHGKYENEAGIKSVVDVYLELVPMFQTLKVIYDHLTLSDTQQSKLQRATNE